MATPAWRAGIQAKDQITAICPTDRPEGWLEDCRTTKNMTLFDAVKLMRGKRGSQITIRIFREGFEKPQRFEIRRDVVKVASVDGRLLEPGYGYVRLRSFQERTADDGQRPSSERRPAALPAKPYPRQPVHLVPVSIRNLSRSSSSSPACSSRARSWRPRSWRTWTASVRTSIPWGYNATARS